MVSLCDIKIGEEAEITEFLDSGIKCSSQRYGMFKGGKVKCIAKPGPVIIEISRQIVAIGRNFARKIAVNVCES